MARDLKSRLEFTERVYPSTVVFHKSGERTHYNMKRVSEMAREHYRYINT